MMVIGFLTSNYYFVFISIKDFEKQIFFFGDQQLENLLFGSMDENTVLWNYIISDIDVL